MKRTTGNSPHKAWPTQTLLCGLISFLTIVGATSKALVAEVTSSNSGKLSIENQQLQNENEALRSVILMLTKDETQTGKDCLSTLQYSPIGTECSSTSGVTFVRYRDPTSGELGWRDTSNHGRLWYDSISSKVDQQAARFFCSEKNYKTLPSQHEFEIAEIHGLREVEKGWERQLYWTGSAYASVSGRLNGVVRSGSAPGYPSEYVLYNIRDRYRAVCIALSAK